MDRILSFFRLVFVLLIIFSVLYGVTKFSEPLKEKASGVLGVRIQPNDPEALPRSLQKDVNDTILDAKEHGMQLKVEDLVNFVSQTQKIVKDYQGLQKEAEKQLDIFLRQQNNNVDTNKEKQP